MKHAATSSVDSQGRCRFAYGCARALEIPDLIHTSMLGDKCKATEASFNSPKQVYSPDAFA